VALAVFCVGSASDLNANVAVAAAAATDTAAVASFGEPEKRREIVVYT